MPNGSRTHRYPFGQNGEARALLIEEFNGSSRWKIVERRTGRVLYSSQAKLSERIIIVNHNEWSCWRSGGQNYVSYSLDFSDPVEGMLLLLHEIGHIVTWRRAAKIRKPRIIKDERLAWAFALKQFKVIARECDFPLPKKKARLALKCKIRGWVVSHKEK